MLHDIKKMKNKIYMIISIDAEEHFDKIQYKCIIIKNTPNKMGIE